MLTSSTSVRVPDQVGIDRRDGFVCVGKADALGPRPGEPGGGVRFPLGGHAITEFGGRFHDQCNGAILLSQAKRFKPGSGWREDRLPRGLERRPNEERVDRRHSTSFSCMA